MWTFRSKWGVNRLHTTYRSWENDFLSYFAIFSQFLQKLAILASIFDSNNFNIWKCNRNVDIPVKMWGKSSSYDLPFLRYWVLAPVSKNAALKNPNFHLDILETSDLLQRLCYDNRSHKITFFTQKMVNWSNYEQIFVFWHNFKIFSPKFVIASWHIPIYK